MVKISETLPCYLTTSQSEESPQAATLTPNAAFKNPSPGASLMAQWLRIHLPMQGTRVQSLVWENPHAAEQLSPCTTTTEPAL